MLLGFDLDVCALGFDGRRVAVLPRALSALDTRFSRLRPYIESMPDTYRVVKYATRGQGGYGLALPDWCGASSLCSGHPAELQLSCC